MNKEEEFYHETAAQIKGAVKSQLFGKPCYKINGKAFCCFYQNCMVFKLPQPQHQTALDLDNSLLFDPSGKGRPMKEWVQVSFENKESWKEYAAHSMEYVSQ